MRVSASEQTRGRLTCIRSGGATWAGGGLVGCAAPSTRATAVAPGVTRAALDAVTITTLADGLVARPLDANFARIAPSRACVGHEAVQASALRRINAAGSGERSFQAAVDGKP